MTDLTATPETGTVDAPVSMDSIIAEIETGNTPDDAADDAVRELTKDAEEGQAEQAADDAGEVDASDTGVEEAPATEESEAPEPTYRVTVNGEEADVPLSELLKGYSREADYTRKTQALADERKTLESTLSTKYANDLKQATDLFVQLDPVLAQADSIDWQALAQEDPTTYTQLRAAVDARLHAVGQARQRLEAVTQQQAQERDQADKTNIVATFDTLRKSDPAFADDGKFTSFVNEAEGFLNTLGLDESDKRDLASHPKGAALLAAVGDAMKWRKQEAARQALPAKKVVQVSAAKPLKTDASDSSPAPRKLPRNANTDARADFVVKELLQGT